MKTCLIRSAKAAVVGAVAHKALRIALPKAIPGGVVAVMAGELALILLGARKKRRAGKK